MRRAVSINSVGLINDSIEAIFGSRGVRSGRPGTVPAIPLVDGREAKYVYWSNTQHRWKAVPAPSQAGSRARSAAAEVMAATKVEPTSAEETQSSSGVTFLTPEKVNAAIQQAASRHDGAGLQC